jgi:hypothetical protein
MKTNIKVTTKNIKLGIKTEPSKCPIANSLKDKFKHLSHVRVLPDIVSITILRNKKPVYYNAKTPEHARTFIKRFDDGSFVKPINVSLNFKKAEFTLA